MIEQLFPGGGGADEKAKVSSDDTTAGYLNGKLVAGSGISLTENNDGGNETLGIAIGNHDASLITTGTLATARLGTGTADATTYLAGDQTYKAAVTSVNGSTGAVTVAAGDTTYALTVADAENTTTETTIISYTIPANTFANGELIFLWSLTQFLNNSGVNPCEVRHRIKINGTEVANNAVNQGIVSTVNTYWEHIYLWRDGSTLRGPNPTGSSYSNNIMSTNTLPTGWRATDRWSATPSFASNITVTHTVQLGTANASTYLRVMNARVVKTNGQYT